MCCSNVRKKFAALRPHCRFGPSVGPASCCDQFSAPAIAEKPTKNDQNRHQMIKKMTQKASPNQPPFLPFISPFSRSCFSRTAGQIRHRKSLRNYRRNEAENRTPPRANSGEKSGDYRMILRMKIVARAIVVMHPARSHVIHGGPGSRGSSMSRILRGS